jgi:hypothetical protein
MHQELKFTEDFQHNMGAVLHHGLYEWTEKFQHGRKSVKDEERAGCPPTSITDSNVEDIHAMIQENL